MYWNFIERGPHLTASSVKAKVSPMPRTLDLKKRGRATPGDSTEQGPQEAWLLTLASRSVRHSSGTRILYLSIYLSSIDKPLSFILEIMFSFGSWLLGIAACTAAAMAERITVNTATHGFLDGSGRVRSFTE